ncbi:DinB family protein [Bacillus sp. AFS015802]|uniref:DinB family protein n=1 Tax=Bacillus sp. AFS015802 TaxID=2033486 RepID=UPI0015CF6110|nr:DinB family protein [Bacillus sp. AFS015802]
MKDLFFYNWQVRDEWLEWCMEVLGNKLIDSKSEDMQNIIQTLFHLIYKEQHWMSIIKEKPDLIQNNKESMLTIEEVVEYSRYTRPFIRAFIAENQFESNAIQKEDGFGTPQLLNNSLHQVIIQEFHHIGQISIWASNLGYVPQESNINDNRILID